MSQLSWWKRGGMALGLLAATLAGVAARPRPGHSAEPEAAAQNPAAVNSYRGSKSCARCHNIKDAASIEEATRGFVRMNEFATWREKDKHSIAYDKLSGPRGLEMARKLGVDIGRRESGCLGCHSATPSEFNDLNKGGLFDAKEGVSCENCHGPSSNWSEPHSYASFRPTGTSDREKIGLIDLRLPARQAGQCLSCHVGDSPEGKVVTHAMYAVGHPPLPSIEVATFVESIPRHWDLDADKPPKIRRQAGHVEGTREKTRLAIVGAAVALQMSMRLVADEAKAIGEPTVPGLGWPDYARFDCWSCHHDLKRDGWRQARVSDGPPGRAPLAEWPLALVELGIEELARANPGAKALGAELQGHRKAIRDEVNARPFGRRARLSRAAGEFAAWSDVLVKQLAAAPYDEAAAHRLLRRALVRAEEFTVDYDAARHIAWTVKILVEDAGARIGDRRRIDPVLRKLDDGLSLILPAGRDHEIESLLGEFFLKVGDYEPAEFRARMKELAELLPG